MIRSFARPARGPAGASPVHAGAAEAPPAHLPARLVPHGWQGHRDLRGRPAATGAPALAGRSCARRRRRPLGAYRYEVRDADGNAAAGTRFCLDVRRVGDDGRSADASHRTFHESLRFPAPAKPGPRAGARSTSVTRSRRFQPVWEQQLDTTDMFVDRSPVAPQPLLAIEQHGAPRRQGRPAAARRRLHARECVAKFRKDAERHDGRPVQACSRSRAGVLISTSGACARPRRNPASRDRRPACIAPSPSGRPTTRSRSERYVLSFENRALREIAANAPYEALVILANSDDLRRRRHLRHLFDGGRRQRLGRLPVRARIRAPLRGARRRVLHVPSGLCAACRQIVEPWEPNVTALLDPDTAEVACTGRAGHAGADALAQGDVRGVPARRPGAAQADPRRATCRRAAMDALFREEQAHVTQLFARERYRHGCRRLPGRQLRRAGLLPPATRLHHVHAQRGAVLPRVRRGPRAHDRLVRGPGAARDRAGGTLPELDLPLVWNFATALLIGALIGIERERHKQRARHTRKSRGCGPSCCSRCSAASAAGSR